MTYNEGRTELKPRRWPGIIILLALIVAGFVLWQCAMLVPWLLR